MNAEVAEFVPRFACLDASGVARVLFDWLQRPNLRRATLVSFAFDPDYKWSQRTVITDRLVTALMRATTEAEVTIVVATNVAEEDSDAGDRRRTALSQLSKSGALVLGHETLHAKVFLFEEEDRYCWVVGSSNLTAGGLAKNSEVSLRGFHPSDFEMVRKSALQLVEAAQPL